MRNSILLLFLLLMTFSQGALAWADEKKELTISAAASLTDALKEIKSDFEAQHSGVKLFLNFGASGVLAKQIEAGAPVDLFISAAVKQMDQVESKGLILNGTRQNILSNEIVLILPAGSKLEIKSFQNLTEPSVKSIALGNPDIVPAGQYSQEVLKNLKLTDAVAHKVVLGEDVRQVLEYVARGEVDAGLVFTTDAAIMPEKVRVVVEAPAKSHKTVIYPVAILGSSKNPELAKEFEAFLTQPESLVIFEKYGFKKITR